MILSILGHTRQAAAARPGCVGCYTAVVLLAAAGSSPCVVDVSSKESEPYPSCHASGTVIFDFTMYLTSKL